LCLVIAVSYVSRSCALSVLFDMSVGACALSVLFDMSVGACALSVLFDMSVGAVPCQCCLICQ